MKTITFPTDLIKEFIDGGLRDAMFIRVEDTESNYKCGFCDSENPAYKFEHHKNCVAVRFIAFYDNLK